VPAARASSAPLPTEVSLARIISQGLIPATAAPHAAAAPVEQAQAHLVFGKQFHQSLPGLVQHPLGGGGEGRGAVVES